MSQYIDELKNKTVVKLLDKEYAERVYNGECLDLNKLYNVEDWEPSGVEAVGLAFKREQFEELPNLFASVAITEALVLALARPVETQEIAVSAVIPDGWEHQEIRDSITGSGEVRIVRKKLQPTRICK